MRDKTRLITRLAVCTVALFGLLAGVRVAPVATDRPATAATMVAAPTPPEMPWGTIAARLSVGN